MGAHFDVEKASKHYQFCLIENNDSELNFNGTVGSYLMVFCVCTTAPSSLFGVVI